MNRLFLLIPILAALAGCHSSFNMTGDATSPRANTTDAAVNDTTPKVTGIGGIFFFSDHPKQTKEWYGKNLGLVTDEYGAIFEFRNVNRPDEINYLQWSPFKQGSNYFSPSKKDFMINYQVQNIAGLVNQLKAKGVTVLDSIATYEYGKFVHLLDPEGNKIELWEPVDRRMSKTGGGTAR